MRLVFAAVALFFAAVSAFASGTDSALLLDALVERGVLTADEAADALKLSAAVVESSSPAQRIRLMQFWHIRYQEMAQTSNAQTIEKGNFALRRLVPVFMFDVSEKFRGMITLLFPTNTVINTVRLAYDVETEYICGSLWAGHECLSFCMEEPESGMRIMTPDRSIINMYFGGGDHGYYSGGVNYHKSAVAFSGYHTGLFWHGYLPSNKSIIYRVSVVNSKPETIKFDGCNDVAFFGGVGIDHKTENNRYRIGVNAGYSGRVINAAAGAYPSPVAAFGDCYGVNPYAWINYENFTLQTEFVGVCAQYGRTMSDAVPQYTINSPSATPWGWYALLAYKFDITPYGQLEPMVRYLHMDTDGRGVEENAVLYMADSVNGLYNKVDSFFAGLNWYVMGQSLKYQLGLEYAEFKNSPLGDKTKFSNVWLFIAQVQIIL